MGFFFGIIQASWLPHNTYRSAPSLAAILADRTGAMLNFDSTEFSEVHPARPRRCAALWVVASCLPVKSDSSPHKRVGKEHDACRITANVPRGPVTNTTTS